MADLDHLKIVVESDSSGVESKLLGIANALQALRSSTTDKSSKNLGKTTDALKTLCKALNEHLTEAVVSRFERLADAMSTLSMIGRLKTGVQISGKNALADIESVMAGEDGAARETQKRAEAEKEAAKNLREQQRTLSSLKEKYTGIFRALGRIALYRLLRSIIKMFTESLSKGLENVYQYSKEVETNFHNVRDDIKASGLYLTNALGAAASSLIENIAPVVIQLLDATADMLNNISEMFAFFRGDAEYTKAIKGNFHDSNEEAKKLKNTLLGFDEINKLNGNNGSGLGSDYSGYFVQEKVKTGRALGTTGIFGLLTTLVGGGFIVSLIADIKKLISVIGVGSGGSSLAGALSSASSAGGGLGTALSGIAGWLGVIGVAIAGIIGVTTEFNQYTNKIIDEFGFKDLNQLLDYTGADTKLGAWWKLLTKTEKGVDVGIPYDPGHSNGDEWLDDLGSYIDEHPESIGNSASSKIPGMGGLGAIAKGLGNEGGQNIKIDLVVDGQVLAETLANTSGSDFRRAKSLVGSKMNQF